jgi:hypothetical protein
LQGIGKVTQLPAPSHDPGAQVEAEGFAQHCVPDGKYNHFPCPSLYPTQIKALVLKFINNIKLNNNFLVNMYVNLP